MREDLAALEAALASLRPAPSAVDRDRLMYMAGRAAARKGPLLGRGMAWLGACAAAVMALGAQAFTTMSVVTALVLLVVGTMPILGAPSWRSQPSEYVDRGDAGYVEQAPHVPPLRAEDEVELDTVRSRLWGEYLELRQLVLTEGVDALPEPEWTSAANAETTDWTAGSRKTLRQLYDG